MARGRDIFRGIYALLPALLAGAVAATVLTGPVLIVAGALSLPA